MSTATLKRITPGQVVAKYIERDAYALQGAFLTKLDHWNDGNPISVKCGCIVGVCFASDEQYNNGFGYAEKYEALARRQGYDHDYIKGLENGFDSPNMDATVYPGDEVWMIGVEDGQAAYKALDKANRVLDPIWMHEDEADPEDNDDELTDE